MDVAGTSTAFLDRDYFLRTMGAALEVEVLGAHNIDDKLGVSDFVLRHTNLSARGSRSPLQYEQHLQRSSDLCPD